MNNQFLLFWSVFVPLGFLLVTGRPYIGFLQRRMMGQFIREDGPQSHQGKAGTPTSGGVLVLLAALTGILGLWLVVPQLAWNAPFMTTVLLILVLGALGFSDDYLKIAKKKNKGLSGYSKLMVQGAAGLVIGIVLMQTGNPTGQVNLFGKAALTLKFAYPLWAALVITGMSNAVNLTDGLDGLASGAALLSFLGLFAMMLFTGHADFALLSLMMGSACLGFLVFNRYPASIFMGDTGSLAIGGAIGAIALAGKIELLLLLIAPIFIIETLSVILQVISFKTTGKRIFKMSPLHHHFELCGWHERWVTFSFCGVQCLGCALALLLYGGGVAL